MMDANEIQQMWGRDPVIAPSREFYYGVKIVVRRNGSWENTTKNLRIVQIGHGVGMLFREGECNRYVDHTFELPIREDELRGLISAINCTVIRIDA